MKSRILMFASASVFIGALVIFVLFEFHRGSQSAMAQNKASETETIKLPEPKFDSQTSVEKALSQRRSVRTYKDEPLTLAQVSQILWAAQGITDAKSGKRTAPSAMALYLLEIYLISGEVTGLPMGTYKYQPKGHQLKRLVEGNTKAKLFESVGQAPIKNAPVALVFTGMSERSKSPNSMYLEAGHAAQNVYLQAVSLKLGTVVMAGFKDENVREALDLSKQEQPIYIMPVGKR